MRKISIIIPNYNGDILLEKNIPYVIKAAEYFKLKSKGDNVEVVIVDDASKDQSLAVLDALSTEFNKQIPIHILQNRENLGFSSTVNKGVKNAHGEFIVLLNTDVRPSENFLLPLVNHFSDEKMFGVGCMEESIEGSLVVLRGRGLAKWRKGLYIHTWGKPDMDSTAWVSGGSGMFRKSIWDMLGGFNELFNPFYWEDIDLSYRAQKAGYSIFFEKASVVTHKHDIGAIRTSSSTNKINTTAFRNQFIFIWTNITDVNLIIMHITYLPFHLLKAIMRRDIAYVCGFLKAFILLPAIFRRRHKAKLMIAHPDKSLQLFG